MMLIDIKQLKKEGWALTKRTGGTILSIPLGTLPTVDPIRAAGGCYCRECKMSGHCSAEDTFRMARVADPFCCVGKAREAQDNELPDWHYPLYTAARDVADNLLSMECALLNDHEDQAEHYREELPARVDRLRTVLREVPAEGRPGK